jgi:hypothetical protein
VTCPSPRRRLGRLFLLISALAFIGAGCDRAGPTESAVPADVPSAADPGLLAVLDPASRDLLTVIEPEESIEATIQTTDPKGVGAAARARGLMVQDVAIESVVVDGPINPVLDFAAAVHPIAVFVADDQRAARWIPAERPIVTVPVAGRPYLTGPLVADLTRLTMPDERRIPMLGSLPNAIQTIDGRPYARLAISGTCDPGEAGIVCTLTATGSGIGVGNGADSLSLQGDVNSGWRGALVDGTAWLQSVPRALLRSAEWTARHDSAAAEAIADYETCCSAFWNPARPGQIALTYLRPCSASVAPSGREIASTGECFDSLRITVDVGAGTVVSIARVKGP